MTTEEQYKYFEELDKKASQGGGVERVEKQHANGHMTARERIDMLLDKGTFNEIETDVWFMYMLTISLYMAVHLV